MFTYATPESVGISSENIKKYLEILEENGICSHGVVMARGDKIFFENYWAPFHKDYLHRQYSVTKSFVSIAIGFLEQEGKISLDDKLTKFFPEESKFATNHYMLEQTLRDMLKMATGLHQQNWFDICEDDRVEAYFKNTLPDSRPTGTIYDYDSSGSFMLGAVVERVTGQNLMDYLQEKLFRKIGVSENAYFLKCPGSHAWGDSALLCTTTDLLKTGRFLLNGGKWEGEQILNEAYVREATKKQIDNNVTGTVSFDRMGYGYQIWRSWDDSFFFNGMGCQFMFAVPGTDIVFAYNADNQGIDHGKKTVVENFFNLISRTAGDPLPENPVVQKELADYAASLKLMVSHGEKSSATAAEVNGVTYLLEENPMGITKLRLDFEGDRGTLSYTNAQGDKILPFGMKENVTADFPQEGYSDEIGKFYAPGHYYKCTTSAGWIEPKKLFLKVQIIDKYFAQLFITIAFKGDEIAIFMCKAAERFLDEYQGFAGGKKAE